MLDAREKEELNRGMKVIRIVWAAMLASLGVYLLVCHRVAPQFSAGGNPEILAALRTVLVAMAAAMIHFRPRIEELESLAAAMNAVR